MKIRLTALLLCLCTLLCVLPACGIGGGVETEAPTSGETEGTGQEATAPVSPDTESNTAPSTTPATEGETPVETKPAPTPNAEELARMEAMLSPDFAGRELPIGGWSTPASVLRDHNTGEAGSYDKAFQLLADAGLNYMITLEEWSSGSWPVESLSSAHKAGLKLWFNCAGQSADYCMERINAMLASEAADALVTIYAKDEPSFDGIGETAAIMAALREALGEKRLPVMANLLPTYASANLVTKDYRNYIRTYLEAAKPDRLMFDYYPYQGASGDSLNAMMVNIAIAREEADKAGIELYTFLQSSGQPAMREPSVEEMRANAHINLAMGVKGFAYFLVCEHYEGWEYSHMLTAKGETTALYDKVKAVNTELEAFKGVFLDYEYKGLLLANNTALPKLMERAGCNNTLVDSFGLIQTFETNRNLKAMIGCFQNEEGRSAYYVVNPNYDKPVTVNLTFSDTRAYVLWTKNGAERMDPTDALELKLEKGDAAILVEFDLYPD